MMDRTIVTPLLNPQQLGENWKVLEKEMNKEYFRQLTETLTYEYINDLVFPPQNVIFRAFNITPLDKIKVVILGQDPYHGDGQAIGLPYAVADDVDAPPSLRVIFDELKNDPNIPFPNCNQVYWAGQGVFLLNCSLTVRAHKPNSHSKIGWHYFTDQVIRTIDEQCDHIVFMLWGVFAHRKARLIDQRINKKHLIIPTSHPSYQSHRHSNLDKTITNQHPSPFVAFSGSNCFSGANRFLSRNGIGEINW